MKRFLPWIGVFLWAGVIFIFSSQPVAKTSQIFWQDFIVKKAAHIVEYCIFCILVYRALNLSSDFTKTELGFYAVLITVFYAFTDEFHQGYTPGREPTVRDIIFDSIGAFFGIFLIWKVLPKMPAKIKTLAGSLQIS